MPELDRAVEAVLRHWERAKAAPEDKDAFLNSVTLNLHGFYNGIERALELIVVDLDGAALGGDAWHTEPLRQVELEVPSLRPSFHPRLAAALMSTAGSVIGSGISMQRI